jgi:hypothetical protein
MDQARIIKVICTILAIFIASMAGLGATNSLLVGVIVALLA